MDIRTHIPGSDPIEPAGGMLAGAAPCCAAETQGSCCEPAQKAGCCGTTPLGGGCGCQ